MREPHSTTHWAQTATAATRVSTLVAIHALALMLLISAALKAQSPGPAAAALMGLSGAVESWALTTRILVIDVLSILEAVLGAALLLGSRRRGPLRCGQIGAAVLLGGHAIMRLSQGGNCGCFGDHQIDDAWVFALLALGAIGCTLRLRSLPRCAATLSAPGFSVRLAVVATLAAATLSPFAARPEATETPEQQLFAQHLSPQGLHSTRVLVSSSHCDHCRAALHAAVAAPDDTPICFVTREGEQNAPLETALDGKVRSIQIPDALWWRLLESAPPRRLHFRDGKVVQAASD